MVRAAEPVYLEPSSGIPQQTVPVLMEPPPPQDEILVAAPEVDANSLAGSRAVSVGLEAE